MEKVPVVLGYLVWDHKISVVDVNTMKVYSGPHIKFRTAQKNLRRLAEKLGVRTHTVGYSPEERAAKLKVKAVGHQWCVYDGLLDKQVSHLYVHFELAVHYYQLKREAILRWRE